MRRLWIKRHKRFVGCGGKMKVYIEDPMEGDTRINGVLCRKLGVLKNGENKRFEIGNEAAKVFVIGDKLSRNVYNEFINIPAGQEDIFLSGKNYYNPFAGNPFRFDGVTDEEVLENRKKVKKKSMLILAISLVVGFVLGIGGVLLENVGKNDPKTFYADGIQITLTEAFSEVEMEGFHVCYGALDKAVFVIREGFDTMEGLEDLSVEEYGQMVLDSNGFDDSFELIDLDGLTFFDYVTTNEDNEDWYYLTSVYKDMDAFWLVQFTCLDEKADDEMISWFLAWADSVAFGGR